ncbi:isovaleryl-dehydrogenase [Blastocystis sp. subtype 4]|uniref:isovaleryl-dehydrogenase n=1 Tax=Blastocystis sp. subtype 4 TaxID=944170 RepID=UPI000711BA5D|nr:isovaleryl-dehydrogenase [Blastocystis sp. subtype 4]KNB44476.1 isovaleryl-dehydrogenase [Blastocystis sp. subtype 4]|eukprot:XP_014527919.1 isovaleryl-dehydrogenase [Blastocystis sp. subtype 4]
MLSRHLLGSSRILAKCLVPLASQIPVLRASDTCSVRFFSNGVSQNQETSQHLSIFNPTEEHAMLRDMVMVKEFVVNEVEPQAMEYNEKEMFNMELYKKAGELCLLAPTVPEKYGGGGMDAVILVASAIIHEELSTSDPAFGLAYLAHSVLCVNNLNVNGNEEQKMRFLPPLCSGEKIGGICISEPDGGTDVMSMKTNAVKKGHHYILNGRKMWITNGNINGELGDTFLVYARTEHGISMFIVSKGMEGFSMGQMIKHKLGMRASGTAELVFDNVEIPEECLVGVEGKAMLLRFQGIAKRCVQVMNEYGKIRIAFNQPINRFGQAGMIQKYIADSYAEYQAGRSYLYSVCNQLDLNNPGHRVETDGVKLFCGPMATRIANNAIQVLGGYGYVGEGVVERLWRDAKLLEIGGGTNEAHEKNMTKDLARDGLQLD